MLSGAACAAAPPADLVFVGGAVYTEDPAHPWAEALAVRAGRIAAVGTAAEMRALTGPHTRRVDLHGGMLMPGLIDDHVHGIEGATATLYECLFPSTSGPDEIRHVLAGCVKRAPAGSWIRGGRWDSEFFKHHSIASPRRWLDEVTGDRPLIWRDDTGHNVWVNSAALQRAHIDASTPDPTGGRYEREADGRTPNGVAFEAAAEVIQGVVPERTPAEYRKAVLEVQRVAHRFGITGIKEADAAPAMVRAYCEVDRAQRLSLYVATSISTLSTQTRPDKPLDFEAIDQVHRRYHSPLVRSDFVKIYLDGVPTDARTAAMIAPYLPDAAGREVTGDLHVAPDVLAADLIELDRRGYTVKMHAAGDRSVREGLDAIAAVRKARPESRLRHELAHAGYIAAEDLPRFAQLNAVAEFSPVIWYPSPIIDAVIAAVGERGKHYWPMRSLVASGAPLAAGSDWPSVVATMDPWAGVQAMVTHSDPYHPSSDALWPEETISLGDALRIYTRGGAAGLRREDETGMLAAGRSADFIVLDRNLFEIPIREVNAARVAQTWFRGRQVYRRDAE